MKEWVPFLQAGRTLEGWPWNIVCSLHRLAGPVEASHKSGSRDTLAWHPRAWLVHGRLALWEGLLALQSLSGIMEASRRGGGHHFSGVACQGLTKPVEAIYRREVCSFPGFPRAYLDLCRPDIEEG